MILNIKTTVCHWHKAHGFEVQKTLAVKYIFNLGVMVCVGVVGGGGGYVDTLNTSNLTNPFIQLPLSIRVFLTNFTNV